MSIGCATNEPEPQPSDREYRVQGSNSRIPDGWRWATCEEARQDKDSGVRQVLDDHLGTLIASLANGKIHGAYHGYRIMDLGPNENKNSFGAMLITRGEEIPGK